MSDVEQNRKNAWLAVAQQQIDYSIRPEIDTNRMSYPPTSDGGRDPAETQQENGQQPNLGVSVAMSRQVQMDPSQEAPRRNSARWSLGSTPSTVVSVGYMTVVL